MKQASSSALLLGSLGAVLFSAKAIVVKLCFRHGADAQTVLALRMLFSLPFFWGAMAWYTLARRPPPIARQDLWRIAALGFVGYYLSSYLDFAGLQYVSAGLERIILYLNPTFVLLISALLLRKRVEPEQWRAMAVAYAGVVLVFLHDVQFSGQRTGLGSALVLLSAVSYAVYLIFAGEIVQRVGSLRLVAYASGASTVLCVLQALVTRPEALVRQPAAVYGLSVVNASLCTFLPMLLVMAAIKRLGPGLAAQSGVVGPVATIAFGWYFLGERVGALQLVGVAVVLVSMWMLVNAARRPVVQATSAQ